MFSFTRIVHVKVVAPVQVGDDGLPAAAVVYGVPVSGGVDHGEVQPHPAFLQREPSNSPGPESRPLVQASMLSQAPGGPCFTGSGPSQLWQFLLELLTATMRESQNRMGRVTGIPLQSPT